MPLRPTFYDFELNDGRIVQVTRNFAGLYKLRAYNPDLYRLTQRFTQKSKNDPADDVEMAEVIYGAYVTAMVIDDRQDDMLTLEEFLELIAIKEPIWELEIRDVDESGMRKSSFVFRVNIENHNMRIVQAIIFSLLALNSILDNLCHNLQNNLCLGQQNLHSVHHNLPYIHYE